MKKIEWPTTKVVSLEDAWMVADVGRSFRLSDISIAYFKQGIIDISIAYFKCDRLKSCGHIQFLYFD